MSRPAPALVHAVSPSPAALAERFVLFFMALIAYATTAIDQMVPRTKADRAKLRRMRRGLALARVMLAFFGGARTLPPAPPHSAHPAPAPNPWTAAFNRQPDDQPRPLATRLGEQLPPFPSAGPHPAPPPGRPRPTGILAPVPQSAHDPP